MPRGSSSGRSSSKSYSSGKKSYSSSSPSSEKKSGGKSSTPTPATHASSGSFLLPLAAGMAAGHILGSAYRSSYELVKSSGSDHSCWLQMDAFERCMYEDNENNENRIERCKELADELSTCVKKGH